MANHPRTDGILARRLQKKQHPLATRLDDDPKIREELIARLVRLLQNAPVALIHQMIQLLELNVK